MYPLFHGLRGGSQKWAHSQRERDTLLLMQETSRDRHDLRYVELSKALQGAFTPEQAEALTDAFSSTAQNAREDLATKIDLSNVEIALRADLTKVEASLRGDLTKVEASLRGDLTKVEASLRGVEAALKGDILLIQTDLRKVETTLRGEIQNLKVETVKWIVTAIAFNLLGTAGLMIALVKFAR